MSFSTRSGTTELQRLPCLKYYYVLKQENRLTSELDTAKNTDYTNIKKKLRIKKLWRITFPKKNSAGAYVYLPPEWSQKLQKLSCSKYYYVLKWEDR